MAETAKNRRGGGSVAIAAGNMNILTERERNARQGWKRGGERRFRKFQSATERFASLKIGETYRSIPPSPFIRRW